MNKRSSKLMKLMTVSSVVVIMAMIFVAAYFFLNTPAVYFDPDGFVVKVEDSRGRLVPESSWDKVLAGQYEPIFVGPRH